MKRLIFLGLVFGLWLLWSVPVMSADQFVWSGTALDTGDCLTQGECWGNAWTSMMRDWTAVAGFDEATEFIYVRSTHNESFSSQLTFVALNADGTNAITRVLSVAGNDTGTTPGALTAGATTAQSATADLVFDGKAYFWGMRVRGDEIQLCGAQPIGHHLIWENSIIDMEDTASSPGWGDTGERCQIDLIDTNIESSAVANEINLSGQLVLRWMGGTWVNDSTRAFNSANEPITLYIEGVDFSAVTGTLLDINAADDCPNYSVWNRVTVNASVTFLQSADTSRPCLDHRFTYTDSGTSSNPALKSRWFRQGGVIETDTARTRTGGASDGTSSYSWSIDSGGVTGNVTEIYEPLQGPPIYFWAEGDASTSHTYRFYLAAGASLDDDEFWITCSLQNDAATDVLGVSVTSRPDPLATPSALTSDGSSWSGTDVSTVMRVDLTHTPDKSGIATCWPHLALDGERVSVDAFVDIDP